jgi:hypothetical protein
MKKVDTDPKRKPAKKMILKKPISKPAKYKRGGAKKLKMPNLKFSFLDQSV